MSIDRCGFTRLTTSGAVSDSGKAILVCAVVVESGGTAAYPFLNNGTAVPTVAANCFPIGPNTISQPNVEAFNYPVMFNSGCYVSFDTNTTAVTVHYILQSNSAT